MERCWSPAEGSSDTICSTCCLHAVTASALEPEIVTFLNSPGSWWSICTLVPVLFCKCLMVSPPFPINLPTIAATQEEAMTACLL